MASTIDEEESFLSFLTQFPEFLFNSVKCLINVIFLHVFKINDVFVLDAKAMCNLSCFLRINLCCWKITGVPASNAVNQSRELVVRLMENYSLLRNKVVFIDIIHD